MQKRDYWSKRLLMAKEKINKAAQKKKKKKANSNEKSK